MKGILTGIWLAVLLSTYTANGQNVFISDFGAPNEPSIIMDPKRPNVLIAASNIDNYYVSTDSGKTWSENVLYSPYGVWGDPVLVVDTTGAFYFFHLSNPPAGNWIDRIVCQKTVDDGTTWDPGTYTGLNGTKAQDKQWAAIDRNNNYIYLTWTQFDEYGSVSAQDSSVILFSHSEDGGATWSNPVRINEVAGDCEDSDNTVEGAVPAVGPNGEVYVAWSGPEGLMFDRSTDQGNTWLTNDIFVDSIPGGWDQIIPGVNRANGLPVVSCDLSGGPNHGTIYINWTDQRNGLNDIDVWLTKSTDGGNTWSAPARVNDDPPGNFQFFTWMTVDQANGDLYFVFYDRRNHPSSFATDVYMARSTDGGNTFTNFKISDTPFSPDALVFLGDYNNITAYDGVVHPIWTRMDTGVTSIWTDTYIFKDSVPSNIEKTEALAFELDQNYPNPATDQTYISFKLRHPATVTLSFYNMYGQEVLQLLDAETVDYGKHVIPVKLNQPGFSAGVYYYHLTVDGRTLTKRFMVD